MPINRAWVLKCFAISLLTTFSSSQGASLTTYVSQKDSTTPLRNPMMGFFFHLESQAILDGDWRGDTWWIYDPGISPYSMTHLNILYVRTTWNALEPTEGNYAWDKNADFKKLVADANAHGFRMAFRANVQDAKGTPKFVVDAIRAAGRDPYPSKKAFLSGDSIINLKDPLWQTKFAKFVSAFGKALDDPTKVDFIDINGLSNWGEGNAWVEGFDESQAVKQGPVDVPKDQATYFDWHVAQYSTAFKNVLLADQKGWNIPIDEKYGLVYRKDGFGGPDQASWTPWDTIADPSIMIGEPWGGSATGAQEAAHYIAARCNVVSFRDDDKWLDDPKVLAQAVAKIGYRLRPTRVEFPSSITANSPLNIQHTWVNDARGFLPNNDRRWNKKYSIAFALFSQGGTAPVQMTIDSSTNPGDFVDGKTFPLVSSPKWSVPTGLYKLAVGILDKNRPNDSSLALAIANPTKRKGWYLLGDLQITATTSLPAAPFHSKPSISIQVLGSKLVVTGMESPKTLIQIFANNGREIMSRSTNGTSMTMPLETLSPGMYLLRATSQNGSLLHEFVHH